MRLTSVFLLSAVAVFADDPKPVTLPDTLGDLAQGARLFRNQCGLCHGPKGEGSRGPMLTRAKLRRAPDDVTLVKILNEGIRGTEMPGSKDVMSEREVLQTAAYVRSLGKIEMEPVPGDSLRGAELYKEKGTCSTCHSLHGEGGVAGPDLTDIGDRRSVRYLRESLVNPETDLPDGYLLVVLTAKDGRTLTGVRVNEDSFSIQVRDHAGKSYSFWKTELSGIEKKRGKSTMPSFKSRFTDGEMIDLVAYLASLKDSK
jgi:putative heme-binding domain-containing protein